MTTEELIPVLKALHADPRCSPMMADWFEDNGEYPVAEWLRRGRAENLYGSQLIHCLMQIPTTEEGRIMRAITEEAFSRWDFSQSRKQIDVTIRPQISGIFVRRHGMRVSREAASEWHRLWRRVMVPPNVSQWVIPFSEGGNHLSSVFLFKHTLKIPAHKWCLDGSQLNLWVSVWIGTYERFACYVSELSREHVEPEPWINTNYFPIA